jgi:hypothetical protein
MSIVEYNSGPMTHAKLMKMSKWQLATMCMGLIRQRDEELTQIQKRVEEILFEFNIVREKENE